MTKKWKSRVVSLRPYGLRYLASREPPIRYAALKIQSQPSLAYELSFDSSLVKIGCLGAENSCCMQTNRQTLQECIYIYM